MKMINYIIILLTAGLMSCCNDGSGPVDPPIDKEVFEVIWTQRIEQEYEVGSLADGQLFEDWFLVPGDINFPATIYGMNKHSGVRDWKYEYAGWDNTNINYNVIEENIMIGITSKRVFGFDVKLKNVAWEIDLVNNNYYPNKSTSIHNGYLYSSQSVNGVGLNSDAAAIIKVDIHTGEYQEIYRVTSDSVGLKTTSPPILYTEDNGHDIMIFSERPNAQFSPPEVQQEIIAFDITDDLELWRTKNFSQFYASNGLHPPIIYNDIVITGGDWSMYGFNINTGQQLWRTEVPNYDKFAIWRKTNHLIKDDRLYVNPNGNEIMCLNPQDGSVIWQNLEDAPNCSDNMVYYEKEDYLVFTSWGLGSVMVLDALTGEKIHREHEYDNSSYNNDVVYDPETDMFFTSTYKHAIGFKINAPE